MQRIIRLTALSFAVSFILVACVVFPVAPEETEQRNDVGAAVEATMEASVALAVEATIAARDADTDSAELAETDTELADSASEGDSESAVSEPTNEPEPPLLITPTPDQSGEISEFILANTRHLRGDPDAAVVLVEFSDFM